MPGAPTASCAHKGSENAHEYSQRGRQKHPAFPTQWFTAYSALFPEIGLSCLRRPHEAASHELDASVEASEPHAFAVRLSAVRYRHLSVHRISPRVRDDREPPLRWDETAGISEVIWVWCEEGIFLQRGLDGKVRARLICPTGCASSLRRNHCR